MDPSELGEPIFEKYFPILSDSISKFREITSFDKFIARRDEYLEANEKCANTKTLTDMNSILKDFALNEVCVSLMNLVNDEI